MVLNIEVVDFVQLGDFFPSHCIIITLLTSCWVLALYSSEGLKCVEAHYALSPKKNFWCMRLVAKIPHSIS